MAEEAKDDNYQLSEPPSSSSSNPPLLFVDVNLGPNDQRRIVVYEGD